jgi:hypothetical protein
MTGLEVDPDNLNETADLPGRRESLVVNDADIQFKKKSEDGITHFSPHIAPYRAVVERVFGAMKKWKILCSLPFTSKVDVDQLHSIITLVGALCNYNLSVRGKKW